jgi:hypothetical protein
VLIEEVLRVFICTPSEYWPCVGGGEQEEEEEAGFRQCRKPSRCFMFSLGRVGEEAVDE